MNFVAKLKCKLSIVIVWLWFLIIEIFVVKFIAFINVEDLFIVVLRKVESGINVVLWVELDCFWVVIFEWWRLFVFGLIDDLEKIVYDTGFGTMTLFIICIDDFVVVWNW